MHPKNNLKLALDAAEFMQYCGLTPDKWQADYLREREDTLLLCHRQSGKSTTTAFLAVHEALFYPPALVLLVSPGFRQSLELFIKVKAAYKIASGGEMATIKINETTLELPNGSRVVALPGKEETIRGYSGPSLVIIDEASRVLDELYYSVRPMLAVSKGRLIGLSTPFGKRGWFHKEYMEGEGWKRFKVTVDQTPRITKEFIAKERASMPDWWFIQEYMCEFVQTLDSVFSHEDVMNAMKDDIEPLFLGSEF